MVVNQIIANFNIVAVQLVDLMLVAHFRYFILVIFVQVQDLGLESFLLLIESHQLLQQLLAAPLGSDAEAMLGRRRSRMLVLLSRRVFNYVFVYIALEIVRSGFNFWLQRRLLGPVWAGVEVRLVGQLDVLLLRSLPHFGKWLRLGKLFFLRQLLITNYLFLGWLVACPEFGYFLPQVLPKILTFARLTEILRYFFRFGLTNWCIFINFLRLFVWGVL